MQPDERRERRVELFATILLAVAAVATAWSTYQSTQWRGQQAVSTSKGTAARIESSDDAELANQRADNYVLAVVLLASALFFAGISTKLQRLRQREALLALGWLIFLGTVIWLITSPVQISV